MTLWSPRREDVAPALWIVLLPLLVALPQLTGWLNADPLVYTGGMTRDLVPGFVPGFPKIDPNSGFTTQALGYRAALDWLQGNVPWWNPYSGVGLPLAAEYQPAAFFPLTLLLLLPKGILWQHFLLQVLSGLGTYALLRQMGLTRLAATTGGALFAFNGTLAWFSHGPAQPVAFLPWMLLGIERARAKATLGLRGGWRLFAAAMAMSLLAGFPETAYINGLLALAWAVLRGVETPGARRAAYAARIALGGVVGIALAAPQILAFFQFLPHAFVGGHATDFSQAALMPISIVPSLIAPYAYGPIFGYPGLWPTSVFVWGPIGGYVSVIALVAATYGVVARRTALGALLLAWCVLALARTFGIEPALTLWNLVPGIPVTAFFRYAQPSWELALIILAAWGLDDLQRSGQTQRAAWLAATLVAIVALGGLLFYGLRLWPELRAHVGLRNPLLASAAWALVTTAVFLTLLRRGRARKLAMLLAFDAAFFFAVPSLSSPRGGSADLPAIAFLRQNIGLQRFYSLGPISPNYGAYFGIASINHNYLPVSARWADWVKSRLDRGVTDATVFNGVRAPGGLDPAHELRANFDAYQWVGVKYVVAPGSDDPFADGRGGQPRNAAVKKVYSDRVMSIYELPDPRPYFDAVAGPCSIRSHDRARATVSCDAPARLVRRELYFPGWSATVNGASAPIAEHEGLFQQVELPKGSSEVRFAYAPAHIAWAWLASLLALIALAAPPLWRAMARNAMKGAKARVIGTTGIR